MVTLCDRRVLYAIIEYCDILHYVFVIYVVYYSEHYLVRTGGSNPIYGTGGSPLRHIDRRVVIEMYP